MWSIEQLYIELGYFLLYPDQNTSKAMFVFLFVCLIFSLGSLVIFHTYMEVHSVIPNAPKALKNIEPEVTWGVLSPKSLSGPYTPTMGLKWLAIDAIGISKYPICTVLTDAHIVSKVHIWLIVLWPLGLSQTTLIQNLSLPCHIERQQIDPSIGPTALFC